MKRPLRLAAPRAWLSPATALLLTSATAAQEPSEDPFFRQAEKLGWDLTDRYACPGVAIARIRDGELAWAQGCGYANLETEDPVTPETVFNIGSISKTVAAWGLLELVEQGKLDLDAPVERYLTRWKLPASRFGTEGVTLRRLLSHTAGLSLHGYPGYLTEAGPPTIEESLSGESNAGELGFLSRPGTLWEYSGGGYTISQLLVEEVTGRDFAEYMKAEVLDPLGLDSTDYRWTDEIRALAATPYDERQEPIEGPYFIALAAAGCQTSVVDLARFGIASMAADAASSEEGALLSPRTLAEMQKTSDVSPGYGLGYEVHDEGGIRVIGHSGSNQGWMSMLALAPELGDGLVVLTNGTNGGRLLGPLRRAWLETLHAASGE